MAITSLSFILFIIAVFLLYYMLPKRCQWVILLCASIVFYLFCGAKTILYVLITATTIYGATLWMQNISQKRKKVLKEADPALTKEEKAAVKGRYNRKRKAIMITTLLINIGLLCVFKYFHFALEQVNAVAGIFHWGGVQDTYSLIVPLGISFYTFQAVGYLVDVYWEYYRPEKNYFKVLLFVSFFPQMTQGPISDYEALSSELFREHKFEYKNYAWGAQRMIWGFAKKMLVANSFAFCVQKVFLNYTEYTGISVLIGAFLYSVQIYADFSGYMDIMCGYCEMLGIRLSENFERPYFSKSIEEYWRRWHITLGAWFKKYIYYPIGMSNWSRKLAKNMKAKLGKHIGDTVPASIALVVTWLATGLWHGASWAYIAWGIVNGFFIIFSLWMKPLYAKAKEICRINESAWLWRAFQTIRTFILVTFIKVLPEVGTLSDGFGLWKRIFTEHTIPHSFSSLFPFFSGEPTIFKICFLIGICGTVAMFICSLLQRKVPVRYYFNKIPFCVRIMILAVLTVIIIAFGVEASWGNGGFMYANF